MKILLAQLPHFYDGTFRPPNLYPLGLGYLANALREHKRAGRSIVVERDGKIVAIPPHKIRVPRAG